MKHRESLELLSASVTLGVSLYIAFGPLRHRLPRVLTRFARLSAVLKLLALSGLCLFATWQNHLHHGSMALRWALVILALALLAGAAYIATRPAIAKPRPDSRQVRRAKQARAQRAARRTPSLPGRGIDLNGA